MNKKSSKDQHLAKWRQDNKAKDSLKLHLEDDRAAYIHVGGRVIYIDNSTGNMLVEMWDDGDEEGEVETLHILDAKLHW